LSDEISSIQQSKNIADLFRVSYPYRHWPARVKSKLDQPGKPWPEILLVNLTVSEI
jgi:hypothetical protein